MAKSVGAWINVRVARAVQAARLAVQAHEPYERVPCLGGAAQGTPVGNAVFLCAV
jgi:hypothetical protein